MAKLRAAAAELGYWPATTDDEHLAKRRADNKRFDRMNAHDRQGLKWSQMASRWHRGAAMTLEEWVGHRIKVSQPACCPTRDTAG